MPVIKVYGLPSEPYGSYGNRSQHAIESDLYLLKLEIKAQVADMLGLGAAEVSVFFPTDIIHSQHEVIVFIDGLFDKPERTQEVKRELARNVGLCILTHPLFSPKKNNKRPLVEVFITSFNPVQGFWSSNTVTIREE